MGIAMGLLFAKAVALSLMDMGPLAGNPAAEGRDLQDLQGPEERGMQYQSWPAVLDNAIEVFSSLAGSGKEGAHMAYSIIFPGTKWCGKGNKASSYDDLGWFSAADMCCREHDFCPDGIRPGASEHGILNPYHEMNVMLCACDHRFLLCLHYADSRAADEISRMFYDFLAPNCLAFDHPVVKCTMTDYSGRCLQYMRNESQPKVWQLQEVPHTYDPEAPAKGANLDELRYQAADAMDGQEAPIEPGKRPHWEALFMLDVIPTTTTPSPPKRFWIF